ncbi:MAG: hypothetical protein KDE47_12975, partial [Caldilineaceae bacterium]|nr:hypothetical protein [Caldilineaceae bacterium]
ATLCTPVDPLALRKSCIFEMISVHPRTTENGRLILARFDPMSAGKFRSEHCSILSKWRIADTPDSGYNMSQ